MKTKLTMLFLYSLLNAFALAAQNPRSTIAVMNMDAQGLDYDSATVAFIVRLEVDKTEKYTVIDKYEMRDVFNTAGHDMDNCFSRSCLVTAGKLLDADKMLSGDIARFGQKIIITLRLIDVKTETIERSEATEYLNIQLELQKMVEISVKKLFEMEPDPSMVNQLINYDVPVASPQTTLRLNGPRMGVSYTMGETGDRLIAPQEEGGFDMYRAMFQFGYQKEVQYLSAGDFQALIEFVGQVGGLENGRFIPSLSLLNGFRWGKSGWEIGFGPNFKWVKRANGFFDSDGILGNKGEWHLENDWQNHFSENAVTPENPYSIHRRLDSRGSVEVSTGLVIAAGRTFKSGYLNVPINFWTSPRKDGWIVGFSFGFNVSRKPN